MNIRARFRPRFPSYPRAIALALGTSLLLSALTACSGSEESSQRGARTVPVVVYTARLESIADKVEALGTAAADESIDITPKTAATVEAIRFEDGQSVNKGDVIALLDADEEKAQLTAARAQLAEHLREIERLKRLISKQAAARRDLDARITQAAITRSSISEIEARIADLTLRAPFAGRLGIRKVSLGELVQPGRIITTLDAVDPIRLDFPVPATQLARLQTGMQLQAIADALPGVTFPGEITALDGRIDPLTRSIIVRARIANPEGKIRLGMLMHVALLEHERRALVVPEESVTQRQQAHYLTIVGTDGRAEVRKVSIGTRYPGTVEILAGLNEGEAVVVRGMGIVKPGNPVKIQQQWEAMEQPLYKQNKHSPQ